MNDFFPREIQLTSTETPSGEDILMFFYTVGCLIGCGLSLYFLYKNLSIRRLIRTTPLTPIQNAKSGFLKIRGMLRAVGGPLKSPIANQECVFFQLKVVRLKEVGSGDDRKIQRTSILKHSEDSDVYIEHGSNKLPIDVSGIRWLDTKVFSKELKEKDRKVTRALEQKFGLTLTFENSYYYEVSETILYANRKCFAFGSVIKKEELKLINHSNGIEISAEPDEVLIMTDGKQGSLLTTKPEEVYLDWLNAVVLKSISFSVLFGLALLGPITFWIAPDRIIGGRFFGGIVIVSLLMFVNTYKHGNHFDKIGDL